MSLINKMLQDLDKRHAGDGGSKTLTQQLRPVKAAKKDWRRITLEIGAGLIVGAGGLRLGVLPNCAALSGHRTGIPLAGA